MKHINASQYIIFSGAIMGLLSVLIGAFATHGLKPQLSIHAMGWIQTAVQYQQFHSLAILVLGFASLNWPAVRALKIAAYCMLAGIVLFSGSLYLMAATQLPQLGMITPLGGIGFLLGWFVIMRASLQYQDLWNRNER